MTSVNHFMTANPSFSRCIKKAIHFTKKTVEKNPQNHPIPKLKPYSEASFLPYFVVVVRSPPTSVITTMTAMDQWPSSTELCSSQDKYRSN